MSEQRATSVIVTHQQTQSVTQDSPTPPRAADTSVTSTAPANPQDTHDGEGRSVIEITDSPPRASAAAPGNLAPSGQRPLPPLQQPASQGHLQAIAPRRAQGPQQPIKPV